MSPTIATATIEMLDWIVFALQHAFSNAFLSFLVIILALAAILGLCAIGWGWLWNKKWNPFKTSAVDLLTCTGISLVFSLVCLGLHGLSNQNFGAGLSSDSNSIAYAPLVGPGATLPKAILTELKSNPNSDPADIISKSIEKQQVSRWAGESTPALSMIHTLVAKALLADVELQENITDLASTSAFTNVASSEEAKTAALNKFARFYATWNDSFEQAVSQVLDTYKSSITTLFILWCVLPLLMLAYVAWRAYTDIRVIEPAPGNAPSERVQDWIAKISAQDVTPKN